MKQRLIIALLTVLVFGAGFAARTLTETAPGVPPPPAMPGSEFVRAPTPTANGETPAEKRTPGISEKERARLFADIEKVRPQIEAYHKRLDEISAEFDRDFATLLNPDQRAKFDAQQKKNADNRAKREAKEAADTGPLSDQQIEQLRRQPLWNALYSVAVAWRLDRLTHDFKLDADQQAKVRDLLHARREKFLALIDSSPPPSITYSELARRAERLATEPAKK
jgi:hypothetical protein